MSQTQRFDTKRGVHMSAMASVMHAQRELNDTRLKHIKKPEHFNMC